MFFDAVPEGKPDPVFGLAASYKADPRPEKVNLVVGVYCDDQLKTELIPSVKKAKEGAFREDLGADYLPIDGDRIFCDELGKLAFGPAFWEKNRKRIHVTQTPGGTAALRLGADFLIQEVGKILFIPDPTWPNHPSLFAKAGCQVENYPYYNSETFSLDTGALFSFLEKQKKGSLILFHTACHNPTGSDPSEADWKEISEICKKRALFPFFDFAYQGFGEGLEKDRRAIEIFLEDGHEMLVAYSCSKNFSLYCQRVGALFVVAKDEKAKGCVESQIKRIVRSLYSNPPAHGAKIVSHLLRSESLKAEWQKELSLMKNRLSTMRRRFIEELKKSDPKTDFSYLIPHKGMFSFLDLKKEEALRLREERGVYLMENGRINVAGLTDQNISYVVESLLAVRGGANRS